MTTANEAFPDRPVESHKAWKEMVHRYLAGALVLLVLAINFLVFRPANPWRRHRFIAGFILALIIFQAALGMWTVTLKLLPLVVLAHLLGGLATFALLLWLALRSRTPHYFDPNLAMRAVRPWIITALVVLIGQIVLGGWTSSNYSALACPDLPTCQGEYWPPADFRAGFTPQREVGLDYEGGVLDLKARVAIHLAHRIGAVLTLVILCVVAFRLMQTTTIPRAGAVLLILVITQFSLGLLNIVHALPLVNAVAHNAVAALLLAQLIWLLHRATRLRL